MEISCPKCKSKDIFKRKAVSRSETHVEKSIDGIIRSVKVNEPKFYVCVKCGHKFNIK